MSACEHPQSRASKRVNCSGYFIGGGKGARKIT